MQRGHGAEYQEKAKLSIRKGAFLLRKNRKGGEPDGIDTKTDTYVFSFRKASATKRRLSVGGKGDCTKRMTVIAHVHPDTIHPG